MASAVTTLPQALQAAADSDGGKVFLHCQSERGPVAVTFADLEERSRAVAAGFLARGIRPGDRIALAAPNQAEWLDVFFGAVRIGAVVVTLNVRYRESELEYMLNQSGARLVITSASAGGTDLAALYAGLGDRIPGVEKVLFLGGEAPGTGYASLPGDPMPAVGLAEMEAALTPGQPAMILYTSGTTGRPKGAVLTHGSLLGAAAAQVAHLETTPDDVYVGVLPLNHVGGITCTVTSALLTGSTVALEPAFSPRGMLAAIAAHRVTVAAGVPTMWTLMLADETFATTDTSSVRLAVIGGSNADPTLCEAITRSFPGARLRNLYGLSEVSGACVISAADDDLGTVSRSIGVPLPGVRARVMDLSGHEAAPGREGELHIASPGAAAGYWEMPEESAQTFLPGGWVATGDMAVIDTDGHVVLRGRRKEMFVQGGYNVYPVEVENLLASHPAVAMVAGIGVPDAVLGEVGRYYVVTRAGHSVSAAELTEFCRTRLADYKVPRQFVFASDLPMTPAGKIAKSALRDEQGRDPAADPSRPG